MLLIRKLKITFKLEHTVYDMNNKEVIYISITTLELRKMICTVTLK